MDLERAVVDYAGAGLMAVSANAAGVSGLPNSSGAALIEVLVEQGLGSDVKSYLEAVAFDLRQMMQDEGASATALQAVVAELTVGLAGWREHAPRRRGLAPNELVGAIVQDLPHAADPIRAQGMLMRLLSRLAVLPDMVGAAADLFARTPTPMAPDTVAESDTEPGANLRALTGALHRETGTSEVALLEIARLHGARGFPDRMRPMVLSAAARSLATICDRLAVPTSDPVLDNLQSQAIAALQEAQFEDADTLIAGAAARRVTSIGHVPTAELLLRRTAAELWGLRASLQQARLKYRKAAQYCEAAVNLLDRSDIEGRWLYTVREGMVLNAMYEELGDIGALGDAIIVFARSLLLDPADKSSELFALTHNNLGNSLLSLSDKERSPDKLKLAIQSYRSALQAKSRDAEPNQWALLQSNLGTACLKLGEMTSAMEAYEEAVAALTEALDAFSTEHSRDDRRVALLNLGIALARLGGRAKDVHVLKRADDVLHKVLPDIDVNDEPESWSRLLAALGDVNSDLGDITGNPEHLQRSAEAYRRLVETNAGMTSVQRALAEANLGSTLWALSRVTGDPWQGEEARSCMARALDVLDAAGEEQLAAPIRANMSAMVAPAGATAGFVADVQASPFDLRPGTDEEPSHSVRLAVGGGFFSR